MYIHPARESRGIGRAFFFYHISSLYIYNIMAIQTTREIQSYALDLVILNAKELREYFLVHKRHRT